MNLKELTNEELVSLRSSISLELFRRNERHTTLRRYKMPKLKSSQMLVSYISKNVGYDVTANNRRGKYTFVRYVIANYLLSNTNDSKENIVSYLGISHHSTIYNMILKHNNLLSTNDAEYIIYNDRISKLIKEFTSNNNL
jgi:hypothetical protein